MNKGKVGEWVRHTSSSGKEYYFHVSRQISQWEKPREWLEYEKRHGPVPNTPYISSSQKQNQNKSQHHNSSSGSNHVNVNSSSTAEQKEKERKAHAYQAHQQQQQQQQQNALHNSSSNNANSVPSYSSTSGPTQQHQNATSASNVHHSHSNANNNKIESNSTSSHHHSTFLPFGGRLLVNNDVKQSLAAAVNPTATASLRDTRKPSEDLQAEDMDISPLEDSNSPVSTESKALANSHNHPTNSHPTHTNFQSQHYHYPQHYQNSKNLHDGSESSREDTLRNSAFHHQHPHPNSGRLIHLGNNSVGNNGYHGRDRDRDRDMRDSPRRIDRDFRDFRDKDSREYRDYRDKDSRDRDRNDRDRLRRDRDRDARDSPRRYDRDRNDRDRDHRGRNRDRDYRDNRLRHRSGSRLRDERSRSPRERDSTPERPGGDSIGVSGLGSLGALAALNSDAETTPLQSLAQYFREDLIAHAQDLPGDELERQANQLSDEIMTTSSIQLSKVCAELKMARSLVRLTDIQATLQDQRILFLRQQIKNLEESDRDNSSSMLGLDTGDS